MAGTGTRERRAPRRGGVVVIVTPDMLKLLELVVADKADEIRAGFHCQRCGHFVAPRRLWNCRGSLLVYKTICFECVRWVGSMWWVWLNRKEATDAGTVQAG